MSLKSPAGRHEGGSVRAERVPTPLAALSGLLAAAAALATGELAGAFTGNRPSLVTAVGDEFIDLYAASLKDLAVRLFGTNDKVALVVGIVVVSLVLGALGGILGRRRFWASAAGFAAFGAIGLVAGLRDPLASAWTAWISALVAVSAGVGTLWFLLRTASRWEGDAAGDAAGATPAGHPPGPGATEDPRDPYAPRRAFIAWSGVVGTWAVMAGTFAPRLRARSTVEAERAATKLPPPGTTVPRSAGNSFDVPGLTPYLVPNDDFYRIDTALTTPQVEAASWRLSVEGHVDNPFELTYDELLDMETVETPVTLACVSNQVGDDLIGNARWLGVPLARLLERAGVQPEGKQIMGESVDGFTAGFPTEVAFDGRTALVAVGMNGEPLPVSHGYPARLVVSGLYGYVSATKWLRRIRLENWEEVHGYWIPRGWAKEAPIKISSRIDVPSDGTRLESGRVPVAGVAWSPNVGIATVEVRVDGGRWQEAQLGKAVTDDTWVQWLYEWEAAPGEHELEVRATDKDGLVQTGEEQPPAPDGATGWHSRSVTVE